MSDESTLNYGVGYGRPPKHTQWPRGKSGNLSGRPRRPKSFDAELLDVLSQTTRIRAGNREIEVTKLGKIVLDLVDAALKRDAWAISLVVSHVARITKASGIDEHTDALTPDELEILRDRRKAHRKDELQGGPSKGTATGSTTEAGGDQ